MANKRRISNNMIERILSKEKPFGIQGMKLYGYREDYNIYIHGQITGSSIKSEFKLTCNIYDDEDDLIATHDNIAYGSGLVSKAIPVNGYYDGFPFSFSISVPEKSKIGRIQIYPTTY